MENIRVSINLDGEVVDDIGNFAQKLNMTHLEYIKEGILRFNTINKRDTMMNLLGTHSILGQQSMILRELKNQEDRHFIL